VIFGGHLTFPKHEIVDCGTSCEVTFFCISPKDLLEDFFYRFNEPVEKVVFLKTASSARSTIGNYFLSSKGFTILGAMFVFS
jgi:hypothetical protein